jgi:sporulation protein YlmC with PRC-barrel domain
MRNLVWSTTLCASAAALLTASCATFSRTEDKSVATVPVYEREAKASIRVAAEAPRVAVQELRPAPEQAQPSSAPTSASFMGFRGTRVFDRNGKDIGEIRDAVFDPQSGRIGHLILGPAGGAATGQTEHAVPYHAFGFRPKEHALALDIDGARLSSAPAAGATYDRSFYRRADEFYGLSPADQMIVPIASTERFDRVIGRRVLDVNGEDAGAIRDIVFDPRSGWVEYVLVGGGDPSARGEVYAVPLDGLYWSGKPGAPMLEVDGAKLRNAPQARSDLNYDWDFANKVNEFYGIAPSDY